MLRVSEIRVPLEHTEDDIRAAVLKRLGIEPDDLLEMKIHRSGFDARKKSAIVFNYTMDVGLRNEEAVAARVAGDQKIRKTPDMTYRFVTKAPEKMGYRPIVIGTGPCGILAALVLAEMGFRPLILERGKIVRERTKDTFGFWKTGDLNPESNAQFGEGGAGTFSDGKLHSRIKDPKHYGRKVLEEFVEAGARDEILHVNKPHIGTFRLVKLVENMRAKIEALGGEYRFESKVVDVEIEEGGVRAVVLEGGERIACDHVVLAVGHSARDTFRMLHERGVAIEPKPFSIGVRLEHPQSIIDRARFGKCAGHPLLGAADYQLVHHCAPSSESAVTRSVYSFCMCPGGLVLAAASEEGCVVTNGMSQYSRAERNANSGIVVGVSPEDYPGGPLAGIDFQRKYEKIAFELGGGDYSAPGQLVGDFLAGRPSEEFGSVIPSYTPGVRLTDISPCLPTFAVAAIREALVAFDRQIKGFAKYDAVMTAVETRTSSPIRITRNNDDLQSVNTAGLYPAGEGAGYAGGILSSAVDGVRVAEAVAVDMVSN